MNYQNSAAFANEMDQNDPLKKYQDQFHFPLVNNKKSIYLCGNSLGLQPKSTRAFIEQELLDWEKYGVEGHFHAKNPWVSYQKWFKTPLANLVGARPSEVVPMNSLTANLHHMLVSFYRPTHKRFKILMEGHAFPSDQYALESQVKFHSQKGGERLFDYEDAIIELFPREGEHYLREEDIIKCIKENGDEIALVIFSGLQYYSGQFFDIPKITESGHKVGAVVGFDLAHTVGNIPLSLHNWNVDFAVWCSYKYLNSGPGGSSGIFVHKKHGKSSNLPRFSGWWGHNEEERFLMKKGFQPMDGADGWQLSNVNILSLAAQRASLEIFEEVGMDAIREKSLKLTGFTEYLLSNIPQHGEDFEIITPKDEKRRGAQLSLLFHRAGKQVFEKLTEKGVIADWREPDVIRIAPIALYNSYKDVYDFAELVKKTLAQ